MSTKPRFVTFQDEMRLRFLGKYSKLPPHVITDIRHLILTEMVELGLIKFDEDYLDRKKMYQAMHRVEFKAYEKRQLEKINAMDAAAHPPEAKLEPVSTAPIQKNLHRSRRFGLRSILRRRAGGC